MHFIIFKFEHTWFIFKPIIDWFSVKSSKDDSVIWYFAGYRWSSHTEFDIIGNKVDWIMRQARMFLKLFLLGNGINFIWYFKIILLIVL